MARISIETANKHLENNSREYKYVNNFYLKQRGENTFIRPLLADIKDIEVYSIHNVRMTSKTGKTYLVQVSCHGDNCPLCKEAQKYDNALTAKVSKVRDYVYLPLIRLYNADKEYQPSYEIFSRSTRWYRDELAPFCARYNFNTVLEIQRLGTGKDTTYKLYEARKDFEGNIIKDDISIEQYMKDFEVQNDDIFGRPDSLILDWTTVEFERYLETGTYPKAIISEETDEEEEATPRRRSNKGF